MHIENLKKPEKTDTYNSSIVLQKDTDGALSFLKQVMTLCKDTIRNNVPNNLAVATGEMYCVVWTCIKRCLLRWILVSGEVTAIKVGVSVILQQCCLK